MLLCIAISLIACKEKEADKAADTEKETKEVVAKSEGSDFGWEILFDGSSYENWKGYLADEVYPNWAIEDGAMAFTPDEEGGKNIISKNKYTNFVLSLEWKISEGGNSGIFWGVNEDPKFNEAYETGPEIQVLDNARHPDAKIGEGTHSAGALYDMIAPPEDVSNPAGEWNLCVLEVNHKTNVGKVSLNGTELFTFPVNGEKWDRMVADSKFATWEGFGKFQTGHIGLQDHSDKVWYRNIKIKSLD